MTLWLLAFVLAGQQAPQAAAPVWPPNEVKEILFRIPQTESAPTVEEKDSQLATIAGIAYRVPRNQMEPTEPYAQRVLKKRDPAHPNVKKGQWLSALMRQLYDDLSKRCDALARFERDRKDRGFYEAKAKEAKQVADYIATTLEVSVEGMEGFLAPLPVCDPGEEPSMHGTEASVKNGVVIIENLERVRFKDDQPPETAVRTARGALKEIAAAQKQYNVSASMLGHYEATWRKNKGNIRVVIPASSPANYLNELMLGAAEAEMHTVHIMCMTKKGVLRELQVSLKDKKKKLPKNAVEVSCPSAASMQKCVEHIESTKGKNKAFYVMN